MKSEAADATLLDRLTVPFERAVGLPVEFFPPGEFQVSARPALPPFCRVMSMGPHAARRCRDFHLGLQGSATCTGTCFAGLTSSAIPAVKEDSVLGYFHLGHAYVDRAPGCGKPGRGCFLPGRREAGCACAGACRQTPCFDSARYAAAVELAAHLAARFASLHEPAGHGRIYPAIDQAIRRMRAEPSRPWTLSGLAREAGMHPNYFSGLFRQRTGTTLTAFLSGLRIDRARQLLAYTALPISEIAFACGFRSISQFNRVFKARTGHAPGTERDRPRR